MFQILDFVLFGIMLISGLLALARGLTREILSLLAWGLAAGAAWFAIKQKPIMDLVAPYVDPTKPQIGTVIVATAAFIIALIILSIIGMKISDRIVDSSLGAFDRTLGFIYGLLRGLVFVSICYLFYGWLLPVAKQEDWVRNAVSTPAIRWVSQTMMRFMPPEIVSTLSAASLIEKDPAAPQPGYTEGQQQGLENLTNSIGQTQQ